MISVAFPTVDGQPDPQTMSDMRDTGKERIRYRIVESCVDCEEACVVTRHV